MKIIYIKIAYIINFYYMDSINTENARKGEKLRRNLFENEPNTYQKSVDQLLDNNIEEIIVNSNK